MKITAIILKIGSDRLVQLRTGHSPSPILIKDPIALLIKSTSVEWPVNSIEPVKKSANLKLKIKK